MKLLALLALLLLSSRARSEATQVEKIIATQQAQIEDLKSQIKKQSERIDRNESRFGRLKLRNQIVSGLSGSGSIDLNKIILNDGGTYLLSIVSNQSGMSTSYFAWIVRTTNGVVGNATISGKSVDYVGAQLIQSISTVRNGGDTIVQVQYTNMIPTGSTDVTLWYLN